VTPSTPSVEVRIPARSSRRRRSERDSGISALAASRPSAATGTFIRNTQPHQACESSQPPTIGPTGTARKFAADQTPIAFARSSSVTRTVSAASAITITPAPAAPSTTRAAMNSALEVEKAQATEPQAKAASEPSSSRLRP
jgi:SLT domain-containing protein